MGGCVTSRQSRLRLRFPLGHCPVPSGLRERRGPSHTKQRTPYKLGGALTTASRRWKLYRVFNVKDTAIPAQMLSIFAIWGERRPEIPPERSRSPPQRQRHRLRNVYKILLTTAILAKNRTPEGGPGRT